jgi:hypothetical protein
VPRALWGFSRGVKVEGVGAERERRPVAGNAGVKTQQKSLIIEVVRRPGAFTGTWNRACVLYRVLLMKQAPSAQSSPAGPPPAGWLNGKGPTQHE